MFGNEALNQLTLIERFVILLCLWFVQFTSSCARRVSHHPVLQVVLGTPGHDNNAWAIKFTNHFWQTERVAIRVPTTLHQNWLSEWRQDCAPIVYPLIQIRSRR